MTYGPTYMGKLCMKSSIYVIKDDNFMITIKHENVKWNFWYMDTNSIYIVTR